MTTKNKEDLLQIISIQEGSGGFVHKARVFLVNRRVLEAQLRLEYKLVQTINDIKTARLILIENVNTSVTVVDQNWNIEKYSGVDLYYGYYDVVVEIKEKEAVITQENFQQECKLQISESAPDNPNKRKIEVRIGLPRAGDVPPRYYKVENKLNRDDTLEVIKIQLDKTVFKAISTIYWSNIISFVFWDKETVIGMMFDDYKILPLNLTPKQYRKISKMFGHAIDEDLIIEDVTNS